MLQSIVGNEDSRQPINRYPVTQRDHILTKEKKHAIKVNMQLQDKYLHYPEFSFSAL